MIYIYIVLEEVKGLNMETFEDYCYQNITKFDEIPIHNRVPLEDIWNHQQEKINILEDINQKRFDLVMSHGVSIQNLRAENKKLGQAYIILTQEFESYKKTYN